MCHMRGNLKEASMGNDWNKGIVAIAMLLITGCAGLPSVDMSAADRVQIKAVTVRVENKLPEEMFYQGRGQAIAGAFGAIGAVAGMAAADDPKAQIKATMNKNDINLPSILRSEFEKTMRSQSEFRVAEGQSLADAEMVLIVNTYGLSQSQGFSAVLYPMINVSASLRKRDGTVVWQRTDYVTPQNKENSSGHEFDEYIAKPEYLRTSWSNVSGIVSRMLVRELSPRK